VNWDLDERKKNLLAFTRNLIALRREHANFHRRKFFQDRTISPATVRSHSIDGIQVQDITWYRPDGQEMTEEEWNAGWVRCLGLYLSGQTLDDVDRYGEQIKDESFLFCLNPHHDHIEFYTPKCAPNSTWELVIDTRYPVQPEQVEVEGGKPYDLMAHSAVLFREVVKKIPPIEEEQDKGEEEPAASVAGKNGDVNKNGDVKALPVREKKPAPTRK
jgi:glycogen operon protein